MSSRRRGVSETAPHGLHREDPEGADRPGRSAHCLIAWRPPGSLRRAPAAAPCGPGAPALLPLREGPLGFAKKNFFLIKCKRKKKNLCRFCVPPPLLLLLFLLLPPPSPGEGLGGATPRAGQTSPGSRRRVAGRSANRRLRTAGEGTLRSSTAHSPAPDAGVLGVRLARLRWSPAIASNDAPGWGEG